MAEMRGNAEYEPLWTPGPPTESSPGGSARRPQIVLALGLVVAILVVAVLIQGGLLDSLRGPSPSAVTTHAPIAVGPSAGPTEPSPSLLPAGSGAPAAAISPGLIAVIDDNGALSTMDASGGSRTSYPVPGIAMASPAWSPDGSQVAALGTSANDAAIYVFAVPRTGDGATAPSASGSPAIGPAPVVIYRSATSVPFYLYWTPDGRQVTFLAQEPNDLTLRIAPADGTAPLDGSGPASIIRKGSPLYFDWIDAGRVLVHISDGSTSFTGEVGLDGGAVGPTLSGTGTFRSASASRDGRYVAYAKSSADGSEQLVVASRVGPGSRQTAVFGPAAFEFDPAGDLLASLAAKTTVAPDATIPVGPLRLIDPATGAERTLLAGPAVAFFWSPDGHTIAAILPGQPGDDQVASGIDIGLAGAGLAANHSVAADQGVTGRLSMVDVATGALRSTHVVHLSHQFVNQVLPYFDQYALSHRLWSPDSTSMLLPVVNAAGQNQLVSEPADGSDPRPVVAGAQGFWSP